jgi:hypothetical protein
MKMQRVFGEVKITLFYLATKKRTRKTSGGKSPHILNSLFREKIILDISTKIWDVVYRCESPERFGTDKTE